MVMHNFPPFPVDLVSFNEAILNEKFYLFYFILFIFRAVVKVNYLAFFL